MRAYYVAYGIAVVLIVLVFAIPAYWIVTGSNEQTMQAKTCSAFGGIPVRGHLAAVVCIDPKAQK